MKMMTSTNKAVYALENLDLPDATEALKGGGIILFPSDALWSIGCGLDNETAIQKIKELNDPWPDRSLEVLVNSVDMLKDFVFRLHPRLETLLHYHSRPLSILIGDVVDLPGSILQAGQSAVFRIVRDHYCQQLISHFQRPIVAALAHNRNMPVPTKLGSVSSDIFTMVDYISKYRPDENEFVADQPPVMVTLSDKEELIFLRE